MAMIDVGELAPDFTLRGASGATVRLSDLRGKQRAVLVFYPKDLTAGCTKQLSDIRDSIIDFQVLDTIPYGVNPDDAASHRAFIEAHDFPFDLLVDVDHRVADAYGAYNPDADAVKRTVVVVGKDGRVIFRAAGAPPATDLLTALLNATDSPDEERINPR